MTDIRLIALDIDGTLLNDEKEIPEENLRALREAREAGIVVAIASGRMLPTIEPIEERLGLDTVIISYNGAKVVGPRSGGRQLISHLPVPPESGDRIIDFCHEQGYLLNFYLNDVLYAQGGGHRERFKELYSLRTGSLYNDIDDLREFKGSESTKLILLTDPDEVERLLAELRPEYPGLCLSRSEPEYLEVTRDGVSKGTAIPALAEFFDLQPEQIMAVGDADNDISMLEAAGLGVAVASARDSAKAAADFVTEKSNNEGAVAEAIYRFAL